MFFSFFYSFFIIDRFFLRRSYHVFCMVKSCNNHVVVVIQQICFLFFLLQAGIFFVVVYLRAYLPRAVMPLDGVTASVCSQQLQRGWVGQGGARVPVNTPVHNPHLYILMAAEKRDL